jgi:hypothetical protein
VTSALLKWGMGNEGKMRERGGVIYRPFPIPHSPFPIGREGVMNQSFRPLSLAALLLLTPALSAQVSPPHVGYVYPAGGRQGTTFEVKLGGQDLAEAAAVQVSGAGVTAKVLRQTRPLKPQELAELRAKLQKLNEKTGKTGKTPDDEKEILAIRGQLARAEIPVSPALGENLFAEVTVEKTAPPGPRELRLRAKTGLSNPVVFDVGQLPEVRQTKVSFDPEARPAGPEKPRTAARESEVKVALPAVLNSQLLPGEVDRYRFRAGKDQLLVFRTRARALIPYLADAVPGWVHAVLTLYDADGNEVAFNDGYGNTPDPVLAYKVPADGEYVLEIHDAIYRGREDFVYRIEAGKLPHITGVFPLGGRASVQTTVALEGWNLPRQSLTLEAKEMKPGKVSLSIRSGELQSNSVPFLVSDLPDCPEQEPNNSTATAQKITLPIMIDGRIDEPGDLDVFSFQGRAGEAVVAEVWARRLGSPLDSFLKLTDAAGKVLAFNDDAEDLGEGLMTHHADSLIQTTLPADGTYYLTIGDAQRHGSPAHAYRLRVSQLRPDFELRITPCSINAKPGTTVPVTVHALRKDGFAGEIKLSLTYKPLGFALDGAIIPAKQNEVRMTVQVPSTPRPEAVQLDVEGRALISGQPITHPATPAEDMTQAFAYHQLVPAEHLLVTVSHDARALFPARLLNTRAIKIRPGGTAVVEFAIPRGAASNKLQVFLNEPPAGISLKRSTFTDGGAVLELSADSEKVTPGLRINVIAEVYPESGQAGKPSRFPLGTFPAIPVEVISPGR